MLDTLDRKLPRFPALLFPDRPGPRLESEFDLTCAFGGGTGVLFLQSLGSNRIDAAGSLADGLCFRAFLGSSDGPLGSAGRGGRSLYRSMLWLWLFNLVLRTVLDPVLYREGKAPPCTEKRAQTNALYLHALTGDKTANVMCSRCLVVNFHGRRLISSLMLQD